MGWVEDGAKITGCLRSVAVKAEAVEAEAVEAAGKVGDRPSLSHNASADSVPEKPDSSVADSARAESCVWRSPNSCNTGASNTRAKLP